MALKETTAKAPRLRTRQRANAVFTHVVRQGIEKGQTIFLADYGLGSPLHKLLKLTFTGHPLVTDKQACLGDSKSALANAINTLYKGILRAKYVSGGIDITALVDLS
jgi:hypothetical protein